MYMQNIFHILYSTIYLADDLKSFSCKWPSSRIKHLFRESFANSMLPFAEPCWATTPLMKIQSSPAKSHQIITDNSFMVL